MSSKGKVMKKLDTILSEATALPWADHPMRQDELVVRGGGRVWVHSDRWVGKDPCHTRIAEFASNEGGTLGYPSPLRKEMLANHAYAIHAANVLPELVGALREIGAYAGDGPATTPWQDIVRDLGQIARDALEKAETVEVPE